MARRKGYKRYSAEFKREALKCVSEDGITDKVVCEELGISERHLARWRDGLRLLVYVVFFGKNGRTAAEEVTRLERELAEVKRERNFIKMRCCSSPRSQNEVPEYLDLCAELGDFQ